LELYDRSDVNLLLRQPLVSGTIQHYPVGKFGSRISIRALLNDRHGGLWIVQIGRVWIGTIAGLNRVEVDRITVFDRRAGLPSADVGSIYGDRVGRLWAASHAGFFRRAARSTDGRLWFPVLDGVAVVDPKRLRGNPLLPPVAIEALRVDDQAYPLIRNMRVGPIRKELQFDYTALGLADPDRLRFRYKLEG
jgi:hypothetical protein